MTTGLLITTAGQAAMAADLAGGTDLVLTHVAFGDASGVPYAPNVAQTGLVNERYRATIASVAVVAGAVVIDSIIPADDPDASARPSHGFNVAEAGLYSAAGTLIGVARMSNGYKPPPSSGQAAIATFRFKLAVANPSAITVVIDPQAQMMLGRHVRAPWLTVDGVLNAPPGAPNQGDTYIIGAAPTGAWTGFAHRIAQWVGVWSLASAPIGHHVVDNSKDRYAGDRWLERTATGWDAGLTRLVQKQPGNSAVAGGTANALSITLDPAPTSWADLLNVQLRVAIQITNTGPANLAVTGVPGTKAVVSKLGTALAGADLVAGMIATIQYDGTACRLLDLSLSDIKTAPSKGSLIGIRVYQVPGVYPYTPTPGTATIEAEVQGAGGGSAGVPTTPEGATSMASGGASGEYAIRRISAGFTGKSITVGAPGLGGAPGLQGSPGGASSFGDLVSALGGGGGNPAGPTGVANNYRAPGGLAPTAGVSGDINIPGMDGAISSIIGQVGIPMPRAAGMFGGGPGSGGEASSNPPSTAGRVGDPGRAGIVIVREYA